MPSPVGPELLTDLAGAWVVGLLDATVKGTALLLAAMVAARLLRSRPAAMRHLVWAGALVGLLLLPVLSGTLPPVEVPGVPDLSARMEAGASPDGTVPAAPAGAEGTAAAGTAPAEEASGAPAGSRPGPSWLDRVPLAPAVGTIWLLGVLAVLLRGLAGRIRVAWLARSATPVRDGPRARTRDRLGRRLGLRRDVRLLEGSRSTVPMTWGLVRPRVLLPPQSADWSADCRRNVLTHELAHVRRGDYLTRLIGRVAAAVYWFHPLVWVALRRMRREQEQACDDHVLRAGVRPSEYAGQLVRLARRLRPAGHGVGVGTSTGGGPSEFSLRMRSLLRADRPRAAVRPRHFAVAGGLAALLVGGLAVLAPDADRERPEPVDGAGPVASVAPPPGSAGETGVPVPGGTASSPSGRDVDVGTTSPGDEGGHPRPAAGADEPGDGSRGAGRGEDEAVGDEPAPTPPPVEEPGRAGADAFFHGGGPGGGRGAASTLGRLSPFERASRAARRPFELAANPGAALSGTGPEDGSDPVAVCPEGCTVDGMLRRLSERSGPSGRLDLLRRLAEDPSARSASVLMDLTYRASRASDRRLAVQALADVPGPVGDRYLFQVARANPWVSVRAAAIDELGRSDGDEVVPWLVTLAYNDVSPEVQTFTVSVLARLDRSGAGSGLLQIARSHPEDRVRNEAVYWLVRTGRELALERLIGSA